MNKYYHYCLFFIFFIAFSCTQQHEGGKKNVSQSEQDSLQIESLVGKARRAYFQAPDSMKIIADELLDFSTQINSKKGLVSAYNILATHYYLASEYQQAIKNYKKALLLNQEMDNSKSNASIYNNMGNAYLVQGDLDLALDTYLKSLKIEEEMDNLAGIAASYANISLVYARLKEDKKALAYANKAYNITNDNNFEREKMQTSMQLAQLLYAQKQHDLALIYTDTSFFCAKRLNIEMGIFRAKKLKATIYTTKDSDDSKEFNLSTSQRNYNRLQALSIYKEIDTYYKEMNLKEPALSNNISQVDALLSLKRYKEAENLSFQNLATAFKLHNKQHVSTVYKQLSFSQQGLAKFDSAYLNLEKHYVYQDSLTGVEKDKMIQNIQTKYETEKKETQIKELSQQTKIQDLEIQKRNWQLLGLGVFIFLAVLGGFFYSQFYKNRREKAEAELKQRFLRSQLNPHFIFNALGAIQQYTLEFGAKKGAAYLVIFSRLMRQILEFSREEFISLEDEVETLKNYLDVQKMRFQENFTYEIEIDDSLEIDEVGIPPMFAQPVLENALEHGLFKTQNEVNHIKIFFEAQGKNSIKLTISDNGVGFQEGQTATKENHRSLSSVITQERLDILKKQTKQKITFQAKNSVDKSGKVIGAKVEFELPIQWL